MSTVRSFFLPGGRTWLKILIPPLTLVSPGWASQETSGGQSAQDPGNWIFTEVAQAAGVNFRHVNGMSGEYYLPEITGSGVALFDYDNDGDLDIYFVQGKPLDEKARQGAAARDQAVPVDRLYRNDLEWRENGDRVLRFTDVTGVSGIPDDGYGMGVAAGDFNNDGWVDLYVTNLGSNRMLRNNGNGTFSDITESAGTDDSRWSTSASFLDLNRDGWLDLYVTNYVDFSVEGNRICFAVNSATDYCGPDAYDPVGDSLFLNQGHGIFEDSTSRSRVYTEVAAGLGVVAADFNRDNWVDIYVANDGDPNFLWTNQKDETLVNDGLLAGVAVDAMGVPQASMGVDAGDFDDDGDPDLFMTHIMDETNTLYQNDGTGFFEDRTVETHLAVSSLRRTAFGTAWIDFDNDGWLDLIVLNGAVRILEELARQGDPYPLHEPNQLYQNNGQGSFVEVSGRGGPAFESSRVSRGVATGDIDNDGDMDLVISNNHGPAELLLNQVGNRNHWIGLRLVGGDDKRDMLGATLEIVPEVGPARHRRVRTDGSYCSASDPRVLVGLGQAQKVSRVQITWPNGEVEQWEGLDANHYYLLIQGGAPSLEMLSGVDQPGGKTIVPGAASPVEPDIADPTRLARRPAESKRLLPGSRPGLAAVPLPQLSALEPVVQDQLRSLEGSLREAVSREGLSDVDLSLAYGNAGLAYHAYEMFEPAETCYGNAARLAERDFRWPYMLGLLFHAQGRLDEALEQYRRGSALQPDYTAALINMGDIYLRKNELVPAMGVYRKALELGTNDPAAKYGLGRIDLRRREYRQAVQNLLDVIRSVPEANRVHHSLAMAYRGLGDMEKASFHLQRFGPIGLRPVDPLFEQLRELLRGERSHLLRGRKAFAAGDFTGAASEFRKAVQADPTSARARINLGTALASLGDDSGAIEEFREALSRDSRNHTAHFNLGTLLSRRGDDRGAVEHLQAVVSMRERDAEAHYLLAGALRRLGKLDEALRHYELAVRGNPNYEDAVLEEVDLRLQARLFSSALERLEETHRRLPHLGRVGHALARLLAACPEERLRDGSRALDLALRVYHARPTVTHAETVAMALAQLDRCEEASEWQQGALRGAQNAGEEKLASQLGQVLVVYRGGVPCRP